MGAPVGKMDKDAVGAPVGEPGEGGMGPPVGDSSEGGKGAPVSVGEPPMGLLSIAPSSVNCPRTSVAWNSSRHEPARATTVAGNNFLPNETKVNMLFLVFFT